MNESTGFVREVARKNGPVFNAQVRTPDGRRLQRKLGNAWLKRSRPPGGYITRSQADLRLAEMLIACDAEVLGQSGDGVTFREASQEWLHYVEFDRKRRASTVRDYRREVDKQLIPACGEDTPLIEITTRDVRPG